MKKQILTKTRFSKTIEVTGSDKLIKQTRSVFKLKSIKLENK